MTALRRRRPDDATSALREIRDELTDLLTDATPRTVGEVWDGDFLLSRRDLAAEIERIRDAATELLDRL